MVYFTDKETHEALIKMNKDLIKRQMTNKTEKEIEDNHNWIDEKDCFNSGFDKGLKAGKQQATSDILEKIDEMLKENDDIIKSGKVLPKNVHIPFINGEELLSKIKRELEEK